jgi:hypothetical protein
LTFVSAAAVAAATSDTMIAPVAFNEVHFMVSPFGITSSSLDSSLIVRMPQDYNSTFVS